MLDFSVTNFNEALALCMNNTKQALNRLESMANTTTRDDMIHSMDGKIDSETYAITKICFSLALISTLVHNLLLICFRRIRILYGYSIVLSCFLFSGFYLFTLITCSLSRDGYLRSVFGHLSDYAILASMTINFQSSVSICRQLWSGVMLFNTGSIIPIITETGDDTRRAVSSMRMRRTCSIFVGIFLVLGIPFFVILGEVIFVNNQRLLSSDYSEFANISCNLVPDEGHFYVMFPFLFLVLACQLVCLALTVKLRFNGTGERLIVWKTPHLAARFWITTKFTVTHMFVWTAAFFSVFYASVALWHVFTLLNSLQSIYVTVNSTFSRPVLDLLHQWHEDRGEDLKVDQSLLQIHHSAQPHGYPNQIKTVAKQPTGPNCDLDIGRDSTVHKTALKQTNARRTDQHSSRMV